MLVIFSMNLFKFKKDWFEITLEIPFILCRKSIPIFVFLFWGENAVYVFFVENPLQLLLLVANRLPCRAQCLGGVG
jgi:hypothetical protein